MTWATESALAAADTILAERYPGETVEILQAFDIAHIGWEADHQGALISHDGMPEIVVIDAIGIPLGHSEADWLVDHLGEYRRLIAETEAMLDGYRALGGLFGPALSEARQKHHLRQLARARRLGESDEDYKRRMQTWHLD
jgi:hypothetical protein